MENSTDQSQKSKDVFLTMVGLLGLNAEVNDKVSGRNIILSVSTDEPGRLIGRNGSSLDNVGLLMNRILRKTDNAFPKVIIDVDGYDKKPKREKRKAAPRKERKVRSAKLEKTTVMDESSAPVDDNINVYIDHETDRLSPVTTVAMDRNSSDGRNSRPPRRENNRDNRRDNRRDNGRDNRRDNRSEGDSRRGNEDRKSRPAPAAAENVAVEAAPQQAQSQAPVQAEVQERPAGKTVNKLQMQCRNAAKEVKRWGEDILLPPLTESDCEKALEYFTKEGGVNAKVDNSRSYGDKKRVRISLKG